MTEELEVVLAQVASCNLDFQSSNKRHGITVKAESLLTSCDENEIVLNALMGVGKLFLGFDCMLVDLISRTIHVISFH